jgi:predicted dehydrogenase
MLRVAVIGCGQIATYRHAPAFARLPDVKIVAVCDVMEEKARALGERYQVPVYRDPVTLLDREEVDVADVVTREQDRCPVLMECFKRGKHVFTEKPLAGADGQYHIQDSDLPEVQEVVEAWLRAGTRFGVNLSLRHDLHARELKRAIMAGELGDPVMLNVHHAIGSASHIVDLLRWYNGEVVEVSGVATGDPAAPTRCAYLVFENGTIGTLASTPDADLHFHLDYAGTKQRAVLSNIAGYLERFERDGRTMHRWQPGYGDSHSSFGLFDRSVSQFIEDLRTGTEVVANGIDGLRQMEIEAAITRSFDTGRRERVVRYEATAGGPR